MAVEEVVVVAGVVAPMVVATEVDLGVVAVAATEVALEDGVTRHFGRTQYLGEWRTGEQRGKQER